MGEVEQLGLEDAIEFVYFNQEQLQLNENIELIQHHQEQSSTSHTSQKGSVPIKKRVTKQHNVVNDNFKKNSGHWSSEEHNKYIEFLEQHRSSTMENQQSRKNNKIFKQMSEIIGTRSPSQCRSHHQKFNPFTQQGQKRIKKRKRISKLMIQELDTESQIEIPDSDVQIKIPMTPNIKMSYQQQQQEILPIEQLLVPQDRIIQYEDPIQEPKHYYSFPRQSLDNLDDYFNVKPCQFQYNNDLNGWF